MTAWCWWWGGWVRTGGGRCGIEGQGAALAEVMSGVVTAAVGYDVRVKAKWCEEVEAIVWAD